MSKKDSIFPFGESLNEADALFRMLVNDLDIEETEMEDFEGVSLQLACNGEGVLGPWMRHADETSIALFGKKLWKSFYSVKQDALQGVAVEEDQLCVQCDTDVVQEDDVTLGLRYLIARNSLLSMTELENNLAKVQMMKAFYGDIGNKEPESGDAIPLPSELEIVGAYFDNFLKKHRAATLKLNKQRERDVEDRKGRSGGMDVGT